MFRKSAPREKVVNPMIDSADKFEPIYVETLARQPSAIEVLLGEQPVQPSRPYQLPAETTAAKPERRGQRGQSLFPEAEKRDSPLARDSTPVVPLTDRPIEVMGTVKHIELEGGFWGIVTDKGESYDPMNLPESLKQDGLRVHFWLKPRKDVATTRMWGTPAAVVRYSIKGQK